MMGVSGVLSRITELQSQLGIAPAPVTARTTGTTGTTFASALASATASTAKTGVTGDQIVTSAKKYLGVRYTFGSTDPGKGLDCSALVQRAYKDMGIDLMSLSARLANGRTARRDVIFRVR